MSPTSLLWESVGVKLLRSPFGYLVALLVVLAAWSLAVVVAAGSWDAVRDANLTPTTEKRADAAGRSIAVFTDIHQPERDIRCIVVDEEEQERIVPDSTINLTVEPDGAEWTLIGLLPEGADALQVNCAPGDDEADNASYAYAIIDGFTSRTNLGRIIGMVGFLGGIGVAAATYFVRRAARKESTE